MLRWLVASAVGAVVFGVGWWLCQRVVGLETATAVAVASIAAGLATTPLGWWAGRDRASADPEHGVEPVVIIAPALLLRPASQVQLDGTVSNLPRPSHELVGRSREMSTLDRLVHAGAGVVIQPVHGLGGVGKSELALHYAHRIRGQFSLVWWVTADSAAQLEAGLAALTYRLQPDAFPTVTAGQAAQWALGWLRSHRGWLLVLDNVDDQADVAALTAQLGPRSDGHILITSRREVGWGHLVAGCVRLDVLDPRAATQMLVERSGQSDDGWAAQVAAELGYLPLALHQAAAYLGQTHTSQADYLRQLRAQPGPRPGARRQTSGGATSGGAGPGDDAIQAVARVWRVSRAAIERANPLATRLLGLLSCFAPDHLPREVLAPVAPVAPVDGAAAVEAALAVLDAYGMVTLTPDSVSVHRLVQAVVWLDASDRSWLRDQAVRLLLRAAPAGDPQTTVAGWPRWLALVPHVHAVAGRFPDGAGGRELGRLLSAAASYLSAQGCHGDAAELTRRASARWRRALSPRRALRRGA